MYCEVVCLGCELGFEARRECGKMQLSLDDLREQSVLELYWLVSCSASPPAISCADVRSRVAHNRAVEILAPSARTDLGTSLPGSLLRSREDMSIVSP